MKQERKSNKKKECTKSTAHLLNVTVYTYNLSTQEAEAGGLQV
jgi:hypothetical protein